MVVEIKPLLNWKVVVAEIKPLVSQLTAVMMLALTDGGGGYEDRGCVRMLHRHPQSSHVCPM